MLSRVPLLLIVISAGCAAGHRSVPEVPRVAWSTFQGALRALEQLPDGRDERAPWAVHLVVPSDMEDDAFRRLHEAIEAHGYYGIHAAPTVASEVTLGFEVRLLLADPILVEDLDSRRCGMRLWLAGIPFGTEIGNSMPVVLPRRALPEARSALRGMVGPVDWTDVSSYVDRK